MRGYLVDCIVGNDKGGGGDVGPQNVLPCQRCTVPELPASQQPVMQSLAGAGSVQSPGDLWSQQTSLRQMAKACQSPATGMKQVPM